MNTLQQNPYSGDDRRATDLAAAWNAYVAAKPGSYQVLVGNEVLLHHPVPMAAAVEAFHLYAGTTDLSVRVVDADECRRIVAGWAGDLR